MQISYNKSFRIIKYDPHIEALISDISLNIEAIPKYQIKHSNENHIEHPKENPYECPYGFINENPNNIAHDRSFEHSSNPLFENHDKSPDQPIQWVLDLINSQKLGIERIKNILLNFDELGSAAFLSLIKNTLASIDQYREILDEVKTKSTSAVSIDDCPLSLMEIMKIVDNIQIQIEFLELLNEVLLIKNQVENYWLKRISESPKQLDALKCEISKKVLDINKWCSQHKDNEDFLKCMKKEDIDIVSNEMKLINKLLYRSFDPKPIFQIKEGKLLVYGTEYRGWCYMILSLNKNCFYMQNRKKVELPNSKVFSLMDWESFRNDIKTLSINKKIPIFRIHRYHSALVYYEHCFYAFYSSAESYLEKYDIIKNQKSIFSFPFTEDKSKVFSCEYKNSILFLIEKSGNLYKFDLLIESFSFIPSKELHSESFRMLFTCNAKVLIIDCINRVFESEIDNEYTWNAIGEFKTYRGERLYNLCWTRFSIINNKYIEFHQLDLSNKKIYMNRSTLHCINNN